MTCANDDYSNDNLEFNYLKFNKYLYEMYQKGLDNINILLLISLEKDYYEGESLKKILLDLKKLSNNLVCNFDGKKVKFKVNKISLDVGDVLNRHRWMYRYLEEYMTQYGLEDEYDVPEDVRKKFEERAYIAGKQQGKDWFREHAIPALNEILLSSRIPEDFQLTDGITEIFKGNENIPKIEYICAGYWLNHPKYKSVLHAINEIRRLPNSIVEKTYIREAKYFMKRLNNRGEYQKFPKIFIKYSKKYIIEETVEKIIVRQNIDNYFEFYYHGLEPKFITAFFDKNIEDNSIVRGYFKGELNGFGVKEQITLTNKAA